MQLWWACASILFLLTWAVQATGVEHGRAVVSTATVQRHQRSQAHSQGPHARAKSQAKTRRHSRNNRRRRPDVCKTGRHRCDRHAVCKSFKRFHRCSCKKGWEGNGRNCKDLDECRLRNGGCVHLCTNSPGNYTCSCYPGFLPDPQDSHNCQDVDECGVDNGGCQHDCLNTIGSFSCSCRDGHTLTTDGLSCIASASCATLRCDQHCLLSAGGGPSCGCREGYVLVRARHCQPTCAVGNGGCQHHCHQTTGGPACTCHSQYLLAADGQSCIPSCAIKNGGCERRCHNTATGVRCSCPKGFQLHNDQRTCLDVDECAVNNGGCEHRCINNWGSYECVCPTGYKLQPDERSCLDVNECAVNNTCEHFCTNTLGSYYCSCDQGYQLFAGAHCGAINECSINNGGCSQSCVNTEDSYYCQCKEGFRLHPNRKDCLPVDKCAPLRNPTKAEVSCYHLEDYSYEERCTVRCREGATFISGPHEYYVFTCGRHTAFTWTAQPDTLNTSFPSCSELAVTPGYKRLARLMVTTRLSDNNTVESLLNGLTQALREKMNYCNDKCQLRFLSEKLTNSKKLKKRLHLAPDQQVVRTKFEVMTFPSSPHQTCGRRCLKRYAKRIFHNVFRPLKKNLLEHQYISSQTGHQYQVLPKTYKARGRMREACPDGFIHVGKKCVACSLGSYHNIRKDKCVECSAGTYQPDEAKTRCLSCPPDTLPQVPPKSGARNLSECADSCPAGHWSADGFSPCQPCPAGSFQEDRGRAGCTPCPLGLTSPPGAASFSRCLGDREVCHQGHYWNVSSKQCERCAVGYYQHDVGASSCIQCPASSTTDHPASTSVSACKRHACGGYVGDLSGVFETPNYPGNYPDNARCTWVVKPAKGRRVLVVVPEIRLSHDQCGDYLVLRKSKSPYSAVTFETCSSVDRPMVFTSRSRRMWVHFRSDANNTDRGFRILFVTYNKEYHGLIKTIVRDNKLYSLHNHLAILRDRELLPRLLEVVAEPIKYYEYAREKDKLFPSSFIKLLTPKVRRFFSYRRRRK
ncbi:signal peptide, CUB and EGF-like domain-containing protein 1 isoform X2 [Homarus americanus]|uniref:signal peptide, CUB and EGF-like domain-containing protein 1 isoform X2 n=1 Tax=Homarus americanus TaxID=6706 RepID=UPI001C476FF2|nr:signal peptide, CUB and EGF-like domain-containing protein 1 isoform X2 [Homarus americanus]XP_042211425.1 signal peptide, CUB and EGF-like domain-containing protein 1 isoform X2 [Homarus americanus]XP_042211426.1 signal peptide, CUB and EGF-like domain-containing protein 1 isoform X2 [Homarus americanus]XP_042211427.1 signal peptide, CUB and EGF-like domain-containing protein 1 isoform X2 [Homarus americanus]XP_042211428.1 signal peptide, CUB and EGF-like domain-containing protein 1 isoform